MLSRWQSRGETDELYDLRKLLWKYREAGEAYLKNNMWSSHSAIHEDFRQFARRVEGHFFQVDPNSPLMFASTKEEIASVSFMSNSMCHRANGYPYGFEIRMNCKDYATHAPLLIGCTLRTMAETTRS